ncbi:hypothetical protein A3K79_05610 [Candidatus Bathyarchaeota archaeon RBG_13_46_16b]|nr:MAG: hypothetical protein A3K79_05610 [Candidatus Bathyarchaeota archaeon RBG_13_46_16b]
MDLKSKKSYQRGEKRGMKTTKTTMAMLIFACVLCFAAGAFVNSARAVLIGDINHDGVVNSEDAVLLGMALGSRPGDPDWNAEADLKLDTYVNAKDAVILAIHFGETAPP